MDEKRKQAYRFLLYLAMVDIRGLCQEQQHIQQIGALADWLHNLAAYSQTDFQGFEENWFWKEYENYRRRFPIWGADYKKAFEDELIRM